MPITELLEKNAQMYGDEVSLVEINPKAMEHAKVTWREYSLIETNPYGGRSYRDNLERV